MYKLVPIYVLILFLSSSLSLSSQNNDLIKITYQKKIETYIDTSKSKNFKNRIAEFNKLLTENSNDLLFELIIDDFQSKFKKIKTLNLDEIAKSFNDLASSIGGTKGEFYINKKDSVFLNSKYLSDEIFKIKLEVEEWEISNVTKLIDKYKCFKAIRRDTIVNGSGSFENLVVAWFSPELPSFFGPAGYFGLPGTILELNNGKISLVATKIEFLKKNKKDNIEIETKGTILSQKEYNQLIGSLARERFEIKSKN